MWYRAAVRNIAVIAVTCYRAVVKVSYRIDQVIHVYIYIEFRSARVLGLSVHNGVIAAWLSSRSRGIDQVIDVCVIEFRLESS